MASQGNIAEQDLELLSAYIDNELPPDQRRALDARLRRDADLRATLAALRGNAVLLRGLPQLKPPRNYTLDPAKYARRPRMAFSTAMLRWSGALGSAAAVLLMVVGVLMNAVTSDNVFFSGTEQLAAPASSARTEQTAVASGNTQTPMRSVGYAETPILGSEQPEKATTPAQTAGTTMPLPTMAYYPPAPVPVEGALGAFGADDAPPDGAPENETVDETDSEGDSGGGAIAGAGLPTAPATAEALPATGDDAGDEMAEATAAHAPAQLPGAEEREPSTSDASDAPDAVIEEAGVMETGIAAAPADTVDAEMTNGEPAQQAQPASSPDGALVIVIGGILFIISCGAFIISFRR